MEVVHRGFDSLYVAFQGALPESALRRLEGAKQAAKATGEPQLITFRGIAGHVKGNGASGGYAYIFDTGPCGVTWKFKRGDSPEDWNIFAEVRSLLLASEGYYVAKETMETHLEAFGAKVLGESINRVDFAVDVVAPGFVLDPEHVVSHSQSTVGVHYENTVPEGGNGFHVRYRGRRCETVMVGKMPGRQVVIYDKRREQRQAGSSVWFDLWGVDGATCPAVWRVELRAGKNHLTDWNIRTFTDLESGIGDVFAAALQEVRYVENPGVSNISRATAHPLWSLVADTIAADMAEHRAGLCRGRVIAAKRADKTVQLAAQVRGLIATLTVVEQLPARMVAERVREMIYRTEKTPQFQQARRRAGSRYVWLEEEGAHA